MPPDICGKIITSEVTEAVFSMAIATLHATAADYRRVVEKEYLNKFQYVLYLHTSEQSMTSKLLAIETARNEWLSNAARADPTYCSVIQQQLTAILANFEFELHCDLLANFIDSRKMRWIHPVRLCNRLSCAMKRFRIDDAR